MPPEQIARKQPTPAADIYALGSLLALLLTGEHPATLPAGAGGAATDTHTVDHLEIQKDWSIRQLIPVTGFHRVHYTDQAQLLWLRSLQLRGRAGLPGLDTAPVF
jgi:serine/threonine protein kinase